MLPLNIVKSQIRFDKQALDRYLKLKLMDIQTLRMKD